MPAEFVSIDEVAQRLRLTRNAVLRLAGTERIAARFVGDRLLFRWDSVETFAESRALEAVSKGVRVLVAEDGECNRRLLGLHLTKAGYDAEFVEDGRALVDRLATRDRWDVDIVFVDVNMPRMNGFEATIELRRSGFRLPIVALTADTDESTREGCIAAGCSSFVGKPVDRDVLMAVVARFVGDRSRAGVASTSSPDNG